MNRRTDQRCVSPVLTHFVGRRFVQSDSPDYLDPPDREAAQYGLLKAILGSGYLADRAGASPGAQGWGVGMNRPLCSNEMFSVTAVCFCDIPLDDLGLHMGKYGEFGLSFSKRFLIERGASPVFYVALNSFVRERDAGGGQTRREVRGEYFNAAGTTYGPLHAFLWSRGADPKDVEDPDLHAILADHPEVRDHPALGRLYERLDVLAQFFDVHVLGYVKCFDDRLPDHDENNFYMEREWRAVQRIDFTFEDLTSVVVPRDFIDSVSADFPSIPPEKIRPAEDCRATD